MVEFNGNQHGPPILMVSVEQLRLDPDNPRLASPGSDVDQDTLLKELYDDFALEDVITSLSRNGYFGEEPLIGVPVDGPDGQQEFVVVEGNRRLAALKLLLFETNRTSVAAKDIPQPSPEILLKLNPVPLAPFESRKELIPYLGVRHIIGVKQWKSIAKARFMDLLLTTEDYSMDEIGNVVGNRTEVVQRWLLTLYVLNQANRISDQNPWSEISKGFKFSFLYTGLGYLNIRQYLDIPLDVVRNPVENPVPAEKQENLIHHMTDMYGPAPGRGRGKVSDSRTIRQLAGVYESEPALNVLRGGATLEEAYRKTRGEAQELLDLLREATFRLDQANAIAHYHTDQLEAATLVQRIQEAAEHLMVTFRNQA